MKLSDVKTTIIHGVEFSVVNNLTGQEPAWVALTKYGQFDKALRAMIQTHAGFALDEMGFSSRYHSAPVLVCNELPEGHYALERDFILVNEKSGLAMATDADGDRALKNEYGENSILIKYPNTTLTTTLWKRVMRAPMPTIGSYTDMRYNITKYKEADLFVKTHTDPQVGLKTWKQNHYGLYTYQHLPPKERLKAIFADPLRYQEIEGGMKAVRKDGVNFSDDRDFEITHRIPDAQYHLGLSKNSLSKIKPSSIDIITRWCLSGEIRKVYERITNLDYDFIPAETGQQPEQKIKKYNRLNVIDMITNVKCIKVTPVKNKTGQLGWYVELLDPRGKSVILTEAKRQDLHAGFKYYVYPVITYVQGIARYVGLPELLQEALSLLNVRKYKNKTDFYSKEYESARGRIMKKILETCGKYGDLIYTDASNSDSSLASEIKSQIVCFHYNMGISYKIAQELERVVGKKLCLSGGKSKNPLIHKYLLSNENGTPLISHPNANARRAGNMRAQCLQGVHVGTWNCVVLTTGSNEQTLITRSGQKKQQTPSKCLSIFSTAETPKHTKRIVYTDWAGNPKLGWIGDPGKQIEIKKIIDTNGFKCQVRGYDFDATAYLDDSQTMPIDLIIPAQAVIDKGLDACYYPKGEVRDITISRIDPMTGEFTIQTVQGIVFQHTFLNSGDPAELIPPNQDVYHLATGMDALAIYTRFFEATDKEFELPYPEISVELMIQNVTALHKVMDTHGYGLDDSEDDL